MKVGYARVSTTGQSLDVQLDALKAAGCEKVFREKQSGKRADTRAELQRAIDFVREGDALIVTKLDRMARSTLDLEQIAQRLQQRRVDLIVLDQKELDTTTRTGKLLFTLLGAIAAFERELILERAAEGRAKAMARGVRFGRPPTIDDAKKVTLRAEFASWEGSKVDLARKHGISKATLYRVVSMAQGISDVQP